MANGSPFVSPDTPASTESSALSAQTLYALRKSCFKADPASSNDGTVSSVVGTRLRRLYDASASPQLQALLLPTTASSGRKQA